MIGRVLNLRLMSHPANWAIVTIMALLGALALDALTKDATTNGK